MYNTCMLSEKHRSLHTIYVKRYIFFKINETVVHTTGLWQEFYSEKVLGLILGSASATVLLFKFKLLIMDTSKQFYWHLLQNVPMFW